MTSLLLPERPAIVESILALARTLNTSVVAEGIETEVQARELERLGCTHAQGYLFSRPIPVRAVEEVLRAGCRSARSASNTPRPSSHAPCNRRAVLIFELPRLLPPQSETPLRFGAEQAYSLQLEGGDT